MLSGGRFAWPGLVRERGGLRRGNLPAMWAVERPLLPSQPRPFGLVVRGGPERCVQRRAVHGVRLEQPALLPDITGLRFRLDLRPRDHDVSTVRPTGRRALLPVGLGAPGAVLHVEPGVLPA